MDNGLAGAHLRGGESKEGGPWNNRGDYVVWVMVVQRRSLESSTREEVIADGYSGSLIKRIQ